jgi:arsenate reductase
MSVEKPTVLFLCADNAIRSQLAEALLRHYAGDHLESCSAGLTPKPVHPLVPEILAEVGVAAAHLQTKPLRSFLAHRRLRWAIILRGPNEQNAPGIFPFANRTVVWDVLDPGCNDCSEAEARDAMRRVRDEIDVRVRRWLTERLSDPRVGWRGGRAA